MTDDVFHWFLQEIYSNFSRSAPTYNSPLYNNLKRRLCEGAEAIPDAAVKEIAFAFAEYDNLPMNIGKAIRNEFHKWKVAHPERIAKRKMCPYCDPKAGAGYVFLHDDKGHIYTGRCVCNNGEDSLSAAMPIASPEYLKKTGLKRGYVINRADMAQENNVTNEQRAELRQKLESASYKVRPEHLAQREEAGAFNFDCPF